MMMSMAIDLDLAQRILKATKRVKDVKYIVRRPSLSLKDDHHNGKMDMLSMYKEIDRFVVVGVACSSLET